MAQGSRGGGTAAPDQSFQAVLEQVRAAPEQADAWAQAEELADALQRPDDLAAVYREVLEGQLSRPVRTELARRAARFHEEWFGDDADAMSVLFTRIVELDPEADWALQRLVVVLTVAERWDALLDVYDRALAHAPNAQRRKQLLDEAAHIAKDFAADPNRAVDYLQLQLEFEPNNLAVVAGIERLLERQRRWEDLIEMWQGRVLDMPTLEARATRLRIANAFIRHLDAPGPALEELRVLVGDAPDHEGGLTLLESILAQEGAPDAVRLGALALLRKSYDATGRGAEVIRAIERALGFADGGERLALHREAGTRLAIADRDAEAMAHFATLLQLEPADTDARKQLRVLADRAKLHAVLADALVGAAQTAEPSLRMSLRYEAAQIHAQRLGAPEQAASLLARVVEDSEADRSLALSAAHQLGELLATAGRDEQRLGLLEQLAELEHSASLRRAVLGEAGRLADALGQPERALSAYARRLAADPRDRDALDASIEVLHRHGRTVELVAALGQRAAAATLPQQRRADLVWRARLQATELAAIDDAIATWIEIRSEFGDEPETIDALDALLQQSSRSNERARVAEAASHALRDRACALAVRLGDVQRVSLGDAAAAVAAYTDALAIDPGNADARAGLRALLDDATAGHAAADALAIAYGRRGDADGLLELVETRVRRSQEPRRAIAVLREAATLHELHAGDAAAALESIAHAFTLDPTDTGLEHDLLRLGAATGRWDTVADAYRTATAVAAHPARAAHLHAAEGRVRERELEDPDGAVRAYAAAGEHDPESIDIQRSVARAAARAGRFADATAGTLAICRLRGEVDSGSIDALTAAAAARNAWTELVAAMPPAIAAAALPPAIARQLELLTARWAHEHCHDVAAAAAAAARAHLRTPDDVTALAQLVALQRELGDPGLLDSLLALDRLQPDQLVSLREAVELLAASAPEAPATRELAANLHHKAARLLRAAGPRADEALVDTTTASLARWVDGLLAQGDRAAAIEALLQAATLPLPRAQVEALEHRAARACVEHGDRRRAIEILRHLLTARPDDRGLVAELAALCEAESQVLELVHLRTRELDLTDELARRLQLRLELSALVGELERRGGRVDALQRNLAEHPGHVASIDALATILHDKGRHGQLCDVLEAQADILERAGESRRAAELWSMAAGIAGDRLGDSARAIAALTRQVGLVPDNDALDALARLHLARNEPAAAATCLQRRLQSTEAGARVPVLLRLGRALLQAERERDAIATLEAAFEEAPKNGEVRKLLLRLYRSRENWEKLARALVIASEAVADDATVLSYAREAAEIYGDRLDQPDQAVPVLMRAIALGDADRGLRARLGDGLRVAGRTDEARVVLEALITDYGRRRSPERAAAHLLLAKVLHAAGERDQALDQLELAAGMDASNPAIMHMLAQTAREDGQLDRAERSYRALLMLVRRPPDGEERTRSPIGAAQVLYELATIARERGEQAQAQELVESALEVIVHSDAEAPALQRVLQQRGDKALLRRVLELRLHSVDNRRRRAEVLADLARAYAADDDHDRAFEHYLLAIAADPGNPALNQEAREAAARSGHVQRYADELEQQLEKARRTSDVHVRCELLLRLAEVMERDWGDYERAADLLAQAEGTSVREVDVWRAAARVAALRGDTSEQMRILERLTTLGESAAETRADALYRMAEVQLADPDAIDDGIETLQRALAANPRHERAARILARATDPERQAPRADLLQLFEQVARKSQDEGAILQALERRVALPEATPDEVQEAATLARRRGEQARARALMLRAVELGSAMLDAGTRTAWAMIGLAEDHLATEEHDGAVQWFVEAAGVCPPAELLALAQRLADAVGDDGAVRVWEALLERDPSLRGAWEPLAALYRRGGDTDRLHRLVDETLDSLAGAAERIAMRLELVQALLAAGDPRDEASAVLQEVLREQPDHAQARALLLELLERTGRGGEITDLMREQLVEDQARGDSAAVAASALALAQRLADDDREDALSAIRTGLQWAPNDRRLLYAASKWLGDDAFDELVAVLGTLIQIEPPDTGTALAIDLADRHAARGDTEAELAALVAAHRRAPDHGDVRRRLERAYENRGDWRGLAEVLRTAAQVEQDPTARVAILRQSAALHRDLLGDVNAALEVLAQAWTSSRADAELGLEYASALANAGELARAITVLGEVLDATDDEQDRLPLLTTRAQLRQRGDDADRLDAAIADLEAATAIDAAHAAHALVEAIEQRLATARIDGDTAVERAALVRVVELYQLLERRDDARNVLTEWLERERKDTGALQILIEIDAADDRWDAVAKACARLVALEQGEAQVTAALRLAYACRQLGRPEEARAGLEHARRKQPGNIEIREELRRIYEQIGADRELARLLAQTAEDTEDPQARLELIQQAAALFVAQGDTEAALPLVTTILELLPGDLGATALLADIQLSLGEVEAAQALLDAAMADARPRKPAELALLHHGRSRTAGARGATDEQLTELQTAFSHDKNNGQIAGELADLAEALEQWDLAVKVLRTITLIDGECPISRTSAFLRQAKIAHRRGDRQRAVLWARKAKHEEPESSEVADFLAELGEG
ncbi:MAG: tetratricopeptide repeat protein [Deltaproteobacteria bacterium]|nr:tetratricopeptide repeat protein [Deltaproteobacteria bacterium]